jgi:hypothetical protein
MTVKIAMRPSSLLAFSGTLLLAAALTFGYAPRALAYNCGDVVYAGSSWLGGNGVPSRSNAQWEASPTGNSCGSSVYNLGASPPQNGLGWQCAELAERFYATEGWTAVGGWGLVGAADIYTNAAGLGFTSIAQGSINHITDIVPGDLLVTHEATYGHVFIVDSVNTTANTINGIDQNGGDGGTSTITYNPTTKGISDGTYFQFSGVVHSPNDSLTNGSGSGSTLIPISSLQDSSGVVHVFTAANQNVYDTYWGSGVGPGTQQVGFTLGASILSLSSQYVGGVIHVYAATSAGAVDDIYWGGGATLTQRNVYSTGTGGNVLASFVDSGGYQHVETGTSSGNVYDTYWTGTGAAASQQVGFSLGSAVNSVRVQYPSGVVHVYAATSGGSVDDIDWGGGASLAQRQVWSNGVSGDTISSLVDSSGVQHVFTATSGGNVYDTSWTGTGGTASTWQVGYTLGAVVNAVSSQFAGGVVHVGAATNAGSVDDIYWGGGTTLTQRQVWSNAVGGDNISSLVDGSGVQHIFTLTSTGDIYDTSWTGTGTPTSWQVD